MNGMHKCPVRACATYVERQHLMCSRHWALVPAPMKVAVWTEFKKGMGSPAHEAAGNAAIRAVDALAARQPERKGARA